LVPDCDGATLTREGEDALWQQFFTAALEQRRMFEPSSERRTRARALVGNPEVVFADEPTAALDKDTGFEVVALLRRLARQSGTTTLTVTPIETS
jgi:ABC-type lipoprotein export system ATPase subunit